MTNICEICGCENPATSMYEKEGEVFRMICEYHEKQVNEKKLNPEFKCWEKDQVYFNKQNPNENLRGKFSSMNPRPSKSIEAERELKDSNNFWAGFYSVSWSNPKNLPPYEQPVIKYSN